MFKSYIYYFCLINISLCSYDFNRNNSRSSMNIVNALHSILRLHHSKINLKLYIHVAYSVGLESSNNMSGYEAGRSFFGDLVNDLLLKYPLQTIVLNFQQPIPFRNNVHYDLVFVDNLQSLRFLYSKLLNDGTLNLSHTIIYLADIDDYEHFEIFKLLQMLWQLSIINAAILLETLPLSQQQILLLTYMPFVDGNCDIQKPVIINRYNGSSGRWLSEIYFVDKKLNNFHGCKITCATWDDMPYLVQERYANGTIKKFIGIEGNLLQFMADNLNFSIGMYTMNEREILESFNNTGLIFQEIFNGAADYALGAFHYKPNLIQTAPFSQTNYYFMSHIRLVTNLRNEYSSYEKLAFPFDAQVWLLIGCTFALSCCIICISSWLGAKRRAFIIGAGNRWPYYNLFSIAMGAPAATEATPQRNFGRFLLSVWLLATLVLRSAYQSGMYRMLRENTQRNPPQTIQSVVSMQYLITMIPENARFLSSLPEVKHVRFLNTSELQAFPMLAREQQLPTAIITPYEYFGYFRKVNALSRRLHLVQERIFTQQLAIYVRRNSYLVRVLNEQIMKANSFGFLERWKREYVGNEYDDDGYIVAEHNHQHVGDAAHSQVNATTKTLALNVLSMKELAGIFWIVGWLHLGALIVFMFEMGWQAIERLNFLAKVLRKCKNK